MNKLIVVMFLLLGGLLCSGCPPSKNNISNPVVAVPTATATPLAGFSLQDSLTFPVSVFVNGSYIGLEYDLYNANPERDVYAGSGTDVVLFTSPVPDTINGYYSFSLTIVGSYSYPPILVSQSSGSSCSISY